MAQTNFTPILLYASSTPTNVPSAGNLTNSATGSEIAINIADKNLFFKDSTNAVNTVPIRQSSTSSNGWLSSTDWNTFNNKSNTNGTVTSVAALTLGTTGTDLSSTVATGTTTPVITLNVPTASATNRGALSAADWTTFNGKQAALVSGTNIKTVNGTTLLGSGDVGTISVAYGGTGLTTLTAGYIPYGNGTGAFSSSSALTFNGTTLSATNDISVNGITIGRGAGAISTNTAVGYQALNTTTATNMAAVGYQALLNAGVNGDSTAFGYQAGSNLTTGYRGLYLGASTVASAVGAISETVVGYGLTGKGSNTAYIGGSSGAYQQNNSTLWSITSDKRLKKNIVDNTDGLNKITAIQVRNFEYRTKDEVTELEPQNAIDIKGVQLGAIAQELQAILPDCVKEESTGVMSVNASNLTWYLINAVKELNNKFDAYVSSHP